METIKRMISKAGSIFSSMNVTPGLVDYWYTFKKENGCCVATRLEGNVPIFNTENQEEDNLAELKKAMIDVLNGQNVVLLRQWGSIKYIYWMFPETVNGLESVGCVYAINTSKWDQPDVLFSIYSINGNIQYINESVSKRMGVKLNDILNQNIDVFVHPEDVISLIGVADGCSKEQSPQIIKYRCLDLNGDYCQLIAIRIPVVTQCKQLLGFVLITSEV